MQKRVQTLQACHFSNSKGFWAKKVAHIPPMDPVLTPPIDRSVCIPTVYSVYIYIVILHNIVCVYIYTHKWASFVQCIICTFLHIPICMYICIHKYAYVYIFVYVYIYIFLFTYVSIYTCISKIQSQAARTTRSPSWS